MRGAVVWRRGRKPVHGEPPVKGAEKRPRRAADNIVWFIALIALIAATVVVAGGGGRFFRPSRETAVVEVFRESSPAVVNISAQPLSEGDSRGLFLGRRPLWMEEFFRQFFGESWQQPAMNFGSGIIVDSRGFILTNEHVVMNTKWIQITLADGRTARGEVWGTESSLDLAVVKIESNDPLPYLERGHSNDLMIGEQVIVIGNPLGLGHTCSTGIVSSLNRFLTDPGTGRVYRDLIQIDAAVNPGNSGGPLLNIRGELVGITAYMPLSRAEGIGFAIPIDKAWTVVEDLIRFRYVPTGWLGVSVEGITLTGSLFPVQVEAGVFVSEVAAGSPAAEDLKPGDLLESWDGNTIQGLSDFVKRARGLRVEEVVELVRARGGERKKIRVKAKAFPEDLAEEWAWWHLGVQVEDGRLQVMTRDGRTLTLRGVVVQSIAVNSPAQALGLAPGDLILRLNQDAVQSRDDFRKAIVRLRGRESIVLRGQRGALQMFMTVPFRGSGERW